MPWPYSFLNRELNDIYPFYQTPAILPTAKHAVRNVGTTCYLVYNQRRMQYQMDFHLAPSTHSSVYREIKDELRQPYLEKPGLWLVRFRDGRDIAMAATLSFDPALFIPTEQRKEPVAALCASTRFKISA